MSAAVHCIPATGEFPEWGGKVTQLRRGLVYRYMQDDGNFRECNPTPEFKKTGAAGLV